MSPARRKSVVFYFLGILKKMVTVEMLLQDLFPLPSQKTMLLLKGVTWTLPTSPQGAPEEALGS